jgi:hypothetical protein
MREVDDICVLPFPAYVSKFSEQQPHAAPPNHFQDFFRCDAALDG